MVPLCPERPVRAVRQKRWPPRLLPSRVASSYLPTLTQAQERSQQIIESEQAGRGARRGPGVRPTNVGCGRASRAAAPCQHLMLPGGVMSHRQKPSGLGSRERCIRSRRESNGMRKQQIVYWTATGFVALIMGVSGALATMHTPRFMQALAHLGYPPYFANILGAGKMAGIFVLLVPKLGRVKEWAYAGFGITVLCASYSHFSSGDGFVALDPLVAFGALLVSYASRPASRRPYRVVESHDTNGRYVLSAQGSR